MYYLFFITSLILFSCGEATEPMNSGESPPRPLELFSRPKGFPEMVLPDENPNTIEKWELGKFLFYDTRLSDGDNISCGSCHIQSKGFADPNPQSEGTAGEFTPRNAMGLSNVAYNSNYTWAQPNLLSLEQQLPIPIFGETPLELGVSDQAKIVSRLEKEPYYVTQFALAFPDVNERQIRFQHIIFAISTFVRSLISAQSPYDRFTFHGEKSAMSASQIRGGKLFFSEALECHHCHGGFNFSASLDHQGKVIQEHPFHNTGQFNLDSSGQNGDYPALNQGIFLFTGIEEDKGKFRAPSLRNIAQSAPYMHDGGVKSLEAVIRNYERGGRLTASGPDKGDGAKNPFKSDLVDGFTITDAEREDLIAFLESLSDPGFLEDPRFSDPFENAKDGQSPFPK